MKVSVFLAVAGGLLINANHAPGSVTYTYQTFVDEKVETATTSFPLLENTPSPGHAASSYVVNPQDNAYPTFSSVIGPLATDSPGPGLPNATTLIQDAGFLILKGKVASPANCLACQEIMTSLAARMKVQQETLSNIAIPFCTALSAVIPMPICIGLLKIGSTDIGGIFPAIDMMGPDGQTLCAFMFGTCTLPAPPKLDLSALFNGRTAKPAPRVTSACRKEPLKVLHVSDYHLDMRYIVGSEADCDGLVCCRVFPYTNISAPIVEPASLFGNYLCDTPEPLGTSVFRNVPKVTGFEWDEFSFGIFTGDLVSHDIWELTEPYVVAENLESYQQFFNGLGGIKIFPTLGYVLLTTPQSD
jgi:hypothetical protein